jgi:hypothetical protein
MDDVCIQLHLHLMDMVLDLQTLQRPFSTIHPPQKVIRITASSPSITNTTGLYLCCLLGLVSIVLGSQSFHSWFEHDQPLPLLSTLGFSVVLD